MRQRAVYLIDPVPKPRQAPSDRWRPSKSVQRYRAFCDELKRLRCTLEPGDSVVFFIPMPKSWSRKKRDRTNGTPHLSRPDLSNYLKALEDAVHGEDSHLWRYSSLEKRWAESGSIIITPA